MADETPWQALDVLSPPARAAAEANPGAAYTQLVVRGEGWPGAKAMLSALRPEAVVAGAAGGAAGRGGADAAAVVAGLWLWHDYLAESHRVSQDLATPTGSFWHAIMHRREGDFSNAKYWYARCRHHPVLGQIPALARGVLGGAAATAGPLHRLVDGEWDPDAFVDVVEAVHRKPDDPIYATAVRLQQLEWRALFDHCAKQAAGF